MTKQFVFRARVDADHQRKIDLMRQATGWTMSQLLRALVENAEVQPVSKTTPTKQTATGIRQDLTVAVAA